MFTLAIGTLTLALFAPPQGSPPPQAAPLPETPPPAPIQYVTPFELSDHHERFVGRTISMIGNVDDTFSQRAFTINDDLPWNHSGDILIISPEMKKDFAKVAYVRIRGRVVRFTDEAVQQFIKNVPAVAEKIRDFKDRAIVLAETVTGPDGEDLTAGGKERDSIYSPRSLCAGDLFEVR